MDIAKIIKILKKENIPDFRANQIAHAYYKQFAPSWEEARPLPQDLGLRLKKEIPWSSLKLVNEMRDREGSTLKFAFLLRDSATIESVLIAHRDGRNTVCVSSQAGCPLACAFCATGAGIFRRNLTVQEIVDQVIETARVLKANGKKVTNVVFMGMGEPFLNYHNVMEAIRELSDQRYFGLGARHISVSTIGVVNAINKFSKEKIQANLAFSLHAPNDRLRSSIIPHNLKDPIEKVFYALDRYIKETNRRVMVEYLLLKGVNDSIRDAEELAALLRGRRLYFVNILDYHQTDKFEQSSRGTTEAFMKKLEEGGISITHRASMGTAISGACGQLSASLD